MSRPAHRLSVTGLAAAGVHLLLLATTIAQSLQSPGAQWQAYWIKFLALDFPVSIGVVPLAWLFPAAPGGPLHDVPNFWWPLAYHGTVGTWWWYIVGAYIGRRLILWRRAHRKRDKVPKQ